MSEQDELMNRRHSQANPSNGSVRDEDDKSSTGKMMITTRNQGKRSVKFADEQGSNVQASAAAKYPVIRQRSFDQQLGELDSEM